MARIRSIKPEFWTDRPFVRRVPNRDARMLYTALWGLADEHGRLGGDPYYIKSQVFPYAEDDDLTPAAVDALLDMLASAGKIVRYEVDGDRYLHLPKLGKHQRLEPHKVPSRLPDVPEPAGPTPPPPMPENTQVSVPAQDCTDESARDSDESARDADSSVLLYVAGSLEHVAGSLEHVLPRADSHQPPLLVVVESEPLAPLAEPEPTFEDFWKPWPRKLDKAPAQRAFAKAIKKASASVIIDACYAYAERCRQVNQDPQFIPHAATWLNKERWTNDLDAVMPLPAVRAAPLRESTTDRAVASADAALAAVNRRLFGNTA